MCQRTMWHRLVVVKWTQHTFYHHHYELAIHCFLCRALSGRLCDASMVCKKICQPLITDEVLWTTAAPTRHTHGVRRHSVNEVHEHLLRPTFICPSSLPLNLSVTIIKINRHTTKFMICLGHIEAQAINAETINRNDEAFDCFSLFSVFHCWYIFYHFVYATRATVKHVHVSGEHAFNINSCSTSRRYTFQESVCWAPAPRIKPYRKIINNFRSTSLVSDRILFPSLFASFVHIFGMSFATIVPWQSPSPSGNWIFTGLFQFIQSNK